jgi:hypothetical protein
MHHGDHNPPTHSKALTLNRKPQAGYMVEKITLTPLYDSSPGPCTLHPEPCTLNPEPCTLNPAP